MARYKSVEREKAVSETRQRLLEAATGEFARHGFDNANVSSISLAAGLAKGTVYNYFPSKQELLLALIDDIARRHFQFVAEPVRLEINERRLECFFEAGINFVQQYRAQAQLITGLLYGPDEVFKQQLYRAYLPFFDLVSTEILQPGIAQGLFEVANLPAMTSLIMITYLGCCAQMNAEGMNWLNAAMVSDFVRRSLRPAQSIR
jgi:AcrR family transcriptional regulator